MRYLLVLFALALGMTDTRAAELKVLTAGAFKPVVIELASTFEKGGDRLTIANDTAGGLMNRVQGGEPFDVVIVTDRGIATLAGKRLVAGSAAIAKAGIGVGIRSGAMPPDISTVDAFKRALLAAPSIAYIDPASGGSSGIYLAGLFEKMGIAEAIRPKAVLVRGGLATERVTKGEATIALQQISEIMAVPGVTVVGMLPAEVQNFTIYAAGISTSSMNKAQAQSLLDLFRGDEARAVLRKHGMEMP